MSRPGSGKKPGTRLKVRVKTGKGRTVSQKIWLERQLNDPYVHEAKRLGYRSRAAFKLIEIDDKYRFLKPGGRIIDLGAAPGGWSQVAAKRVKADEGRGKVIAIDMHGMEPIPAVTIFKKDFLEEDAPALYSGVPVVSVPLFPDNLGPSNSLTVALLCNPKNVHVGIWRNIRLESFRDVSAGVLRIVATLRLDARFADEGGVAKLINIQL